MKKYLFYLIHCLIIMSLWVTLALASNDVTVQTQGTLSHKRFPMKENYYSFHEFIVGFKGVVSQELWEDFVKGWAAIYGFHDSSTLESYIKGQETSFDCLTKISQPDHLRKAKRLSVEKETRHIQCLYDSLLVQKQIMTGTELVEMQKLNIYAALSGSAEHKKRIGQQFPDFLKEIKSNFESEE